LHRRRTPVGWAGMNHFYSTVAVVLVLGLVAVAFALGADEPKSARGDAAAGKGGELFHVVSFKFKDAATPAQVKAVEEAFDALDEKIPGIASLKWGTNVSPENHAQGYTHCFVLTFASDKDRDEYLVHPDHQAFGKIVGPVLDKVFVIDFWAK
jgi:hypothetical protein